MVIQLDEGLLNPPLGYPHQFSHEDHERKKDLGDNPSKLMGEKDILPSQDGEDEEKAPRNHKKDQDGKCQTEDKGQGGMNIFQSHQRDIPKYEYEEEKDQTS
jgi:hypothetical protein